MKIPCENAPNIHPRIDKFTRLISRREVQEARAALDRGLKSLRPAVADHETLRT
jgi:hypothetical protein